ncbi:MULTISPECIES: eCIS core domain-containing protein [Nocardia]|uniref:eCIS core domain-containing protein n=1 Tax=Nocardia TaxID=1817 RepID=UPI002490DA7F|nr:DUF4157 domain-containing protein [Nocardia sputorum]
MGNQAVQRILQAQTEEPNAGLTSTAAPRFGNDSNCIATGLRTAYPPLQTKLKVNAPGDKYEQEADRISEKLMRMEVPDRTHATPPAIQRATTGFREEPAATYLQRLCTDYEEEALERKVVSKYATVGGVQTLTRAEANVKAVSGGYPLTREQREFFEPRFGVDLSRVRIHTDWSADSAARSVGALAFTQSSDIYFRNDQYSPDSFSGRKLLAHELTHVIQQGAVPEIGNPSSNGDSIQQRSTDPSTVDRQPNDESASVESGACCASCASGRLCEDDQRTGLKRPSSIGTTHGGVLQRACGPAGIGSPSGCIGSSESWRDDAVPYRFDAGCDSFRPGERARLAAEGVAAVQAGRVLAVDGYASTEGESWFNVDLSCARALQAASVLANAGARVAGVYSHGPVTGDAYLRRSVVVRSTSDQRRNPLQLTGKQLASPQFPQVCRPATGIGNTDCGTYAMENWWLPQAYVHNATCACQETPNDPKANCIRKFLQDRVSRVNREKKVEAAHWLGALMTGHVSKGAYINYVQLNLTPMIYQDHVDAYGTCCCPAGPAPLAAWRGVTTIPLPCSLVGWSIRQYGSCHATPGKW